MRHPVLTIIVVCLLALPLTGMECLPGPEFSLVGKWRRAEMPEGLSDYALTLNADGSGNLYTKPTEGVETTLSFTWSYNSYTGMLTFASDSEREQQTQAQSMKLITDGNNKIGLCQVCPDTGECMTFVRV
ncbi:hypothetical protein ACFL1X_10620 [Candidatus Hydrogenedentota bacterium]